MFSGPMLHSRQNATFLLQQLKFTFRSVISCPVRSLVWWTCDEQALGPVFVKVNTYHYYTEPDLWGLLVLIVSELFYVYSLVNYPRSDIVKRLRWRVTFFFTQNVIIWWCCCCCCCSGPVWDKKKLDSRHEISQNTRLCRWQMTLVPPWPPLSWTPPPLSHHADLLQCLHQGSLHSFQRLIWGSPPPPHRRGHHMWWCRAVRKKGRNAESRVKGRGGLGSLDDDVRGNGGM